MDIVILVAGLFRCQDSVKHYKVTWNGRQFLFGLGKFGSLEEFKDHFSHKPIISGESGKKVVQ